MSVFKTYVVRCEVRKRLIANFPENPELLKYVVMKEQKKEKLTDQEAEKLKQELEVSLAETLEIQDTKMIGMRNVFLKDEKGLYLTPRNVKGWLKEILKTLGVRGYREAVNHGVFVHPDRIYLRRNGEVLKKADGEVVIPIQVIGPRGPRSSVKVSEVVNKPCHFEFTLKIVDRISRGLLTKEVMQKVAELGGEVGFLGDRSLQEGQCDVSIKLS